MATFDPCAFFPGFCEAMVVDHHALLQRFYASRATTLARDLVGAVIDEAEHDRRMEELTAFVGVDTLAMWTELGVGAGAG
jgi:hypothetical protein